MDALSQFLQATRTRSPLIADVRLGAEVSVGLPALGGIPFHFVASGECRLDAGGERISLSTGDVVMLAKVPYYRLQTGDGSQRLEIMTFAERDKFFVEDLRTGRDHILTRVFGDEPVAARIFSAILVPGDLESDRLARDLPPITLLRDAGTMLEPWLMAAIEHMSAEAAAPEPGQSAVAERLIEVIFIAVLRKWLLEQPQPRGWVRGLNDPTISRALNAIHQDIGRRWSLRDLAIASGRSRSGLAARFHEVMGETPFAYLTGRRMDIAAAALVRGDRSIATIATELGYGSTTTFTRAFTVAFGETPARYRQSRSPAPASK